MYPLYLGCYKTANTTTYLRTVDFFSVEYLCKSLCVIDTDYSFINGAAFFFNTKQNKIELFTYVHLHETYCICSSKM